MLTARTCGLLPVAAAVALAIPEMRAADPFTEYVRTTQPLTPETELKTFRLPPGFEIQLFAAEPQIAKPMNMGFDERGRLWITESREYPFPAPLDKPGRDAIKVLEDTDGDGRADKITTFADGLNIPIGIYPYKGGAIAWSIPNIWHFQDTNGDGKADKRDVLFGPLGWERDTHGMNASFRRGYDGWIYITHGFNNISAVKGRDGSEVKLSSGNTYRVRPDGSRAEPHTWGQVNPFGLTFDALGNLYSADCHSSPIYQLLRGAYYPSFGKPDDGLGFAPVLMQHSHNSTAIGGIAYYDDDQWPAEFRDNIFVGNVMTSRVNRDVIRYAGSSPSAKEFPDFVTSDDPWFRPADLQFGPDGALYVADFYNRIIGHYEVPLTHPGRDRDRGRIWRITYKQNKRPRPRFDLTGLTADRVVAELASPNLARRMLAMNHLIDGIGRPAREPALRIFATSTDASARSHALWVLHRLNSLDARSLASAVSDRDAKVRTHAMRVLAETGKWTEDHRRAALHGLSDPDAHVRRAAADALAQHPAGEHVQPLIAARQRIDKADNHLLHTVRMALRNQLKAEGAFATLGEDKLNERDSRAVADVAIAVPSGNAGGFLLNHLQRFGEPPVTAAKYLRHVASHLPAEGVDQLVTLARVRFADDVDVQLAMFKSVQEGVAARGAQLGAPAKAWGDDLATILLNPSSDDELEWQNAPIEGMKETKNPWFVQTRECADGAKTRFLCSLPTGGEHLTGTLRSKAFMAPKSLSFFVAGHDGPPHQGPQGKNAFRLLSADSNEVLMQAAPPRNDIAQKFSWDLGRHAGKQVYFEVVDSDTGSGYAWLAIGRIEPPAVTIPKHDPSEIAKRRQAGAELARTLQLKHLQPQLVALLKKPDAETQAASARTLAGWSNNGELTALASIVGEPNAPQAARDRALATFENANTSATRAALTEVMRISPRRVQVKLAQALAASADGAQSLMALVTQRIAPASLLQDQTVKEKLIASDTSLRSRIEELTKGLSPIDEAVQKLIDQRRRAFDGRKANVSNGQQLYVKNCVVCHQIGGEGGLVGPQLDGIGGRGVERLCEDVLDPNRSVDHAFRTTLLVLKDDDVISGLFRREEGATLVLADSAGKEIRVQKNQVAQRKESDTSLMPENFGELMTPDEFNDLMAYLLSKSAAPKPELKAQK